MPDTFPDLDHLQHTLTLSLEAVTTYKQQQQEQQQQDQAQPQPQLRPGHIFCCFQCPRRQECKIHNRQPPPFLSA